MDIKDIDKKYAVAFVHVPTGEVGRSEYVFSHINALELCKELDACCATVLHFALMQGDNIHIMAKERGRGR